MGYRSNVRIITSKKGFEELQKQVKKILDKKSYNFNLLDDPSILVKGRKGVLIGWDYIKWYEYSDFKDVDAINEALAYLSEKNIGYRFARIGESYDDFEERNEDGKDDDYLPYPSVIREFDDEYIKQELNYDANKETVKGVNNEALL